MSRQRLIGNAWCKSDDVHMDMSSNHVLSWVEFNSRIGGVGPSLLILDELLSLSQACLIVGDVYPHISIQAPCLVPQSGCCEAVNKYGYRQIAGAERV